MGKYAKAASAVISFCMFALPVRSEEKVWYCETTGIAETTIEGVKTFTPEKFKMRVTPEEIAFGSGMFRGRKVRVTYWNNPNLWEAYDGYIFMFFAPELHVGVIDTVSATAISARCDDF